jgi:hypothetical protein
MGAPRQAVECGDFKGAASPFDPQEGPFGGASERSEQCAVFREPQ